MTLTELQQKINVPKSQYNDFGKYNYRSCEDIMQAVKPLLSADDILSISDEIVYIGDRHYVKAIVYLQLGGEKYYNTAYARETESLKGMVASQITGSTSSYARKYALAGLLLLDDNQDADSTNKHESNSQPKSQSKPKTKQSKNPEEPFSEAQERFLWVQCNALREREYPNEDKAFSSTIKDALISKANVKTKQRMRELIDRVENADSWVLNIIDGLINA